MVEDVDNFPENNLSKPEKKKLSGILEEIELYRGITGYLENQEIKEASEEEDDENKDSVNERDSIDI